MGGVWDSITGKSARRTSAAQSQAGREMAAAQLKGVEIQIEAGKEARKIQEAAALVAEEFTRTGSTESHNQLNLLSNELDRIIDRVSFRSGAIVNATFATRIREMRDGFDAATGNLTQGFSEALTTQGSAIKQQLDAVGEGATAQTGELREGLGGQLSALEGAREGQLGELETGTQEQIGAVRAGAEGQIGALRQGVSAAVETGKPFVEKSIGGLEAFARSALDPNNPLFERRLEREQGNLDKLLAARGQFNSGAAIRKQVDLRSRLEAEEQQAQVNRQLQLAQLGLPAIGAQQQLQAGQGEQIGNVIGRGGEIIGGALGQRGQLAGQVLGREGEIRGGAIGLQGQQLGQVAGALGGQRANLIGSGAQNIANIQLNRGGQLAGLGLQGASTQADLRGGQASANLSVIGAQGAQQQAVRSGLRTGLANLASNQAANLANIRTGLGQSTAANILNVGNQQAIGINNAAQAIGAGNVGGARSRQQAGAALTGGLLKLGGAAIGIA